MLVSGRVTMEMVAQLVSANKSGPKKPRNFVIRSLLVRVSFGGFKTAINSPKIHRNFSADYLQSNSSWFYYLASASLTTTIIKLPQTVFFRGVVSGQCLLTRGPSSCLQKFLAWTVLGVSTAELLKKCAMCQCVPMAVWQSMRTAKISTGQLSNILQSSWSKEPVKQDALTSTSVCNIEIADNFMA